MQTSLQVSIHTVPSELPEDDDAVGAFFVDKLKSALNRGIPSPAGILVQQESVDLVELRGVLMARLSVRRFLASLSRASGREVRAVGLMGAFAAEEGARPSVAVVFLEWPDNRWWHWRGLIDARGQLADDTVTVRRAMDGDPMPARIGRWWSLGRRLRLRADLQRVDSEVVH